MTLNRSDLSLQSLQDHITVRVLTPEHSDYDGVRQVWNLAVDHHPKLILIPDNAQDVVAAVQFARAEGLSVAVQLTGHGQKYASDDNLLLITSQLSSVEVNPETRMVRVGAGIVWEQVIKATTPYGLAPLLGSALHVGVVGYTLGGGVGWLVRQYGLAADSVRWIELVTPDGVLRHASPTENSDLFWGLRGGGGNFGVVTALEFEVYPVATVYGGSLVYSGESARDALRFYRDWVKYVPESLTSSIGIMKFPVDPLVPEAIQGQTQVIVRAVYAGDAASGARLIQPWLDWKTPLSNDFKEIPFSEIGTISNDPTEPTAGLPSNEMLAGLSDETIDIIARYTTHPDSPLTFNEIRHVGGAVTRVPANANAIGNRDAQFYLQIAAVQLGGIPMKPDLRAAVEVYRAQYKEALRPVLHGGVYLNFLSGSEAHTRVRDAYRPDSYGRLVALKAKYDPTNMFRYSYPLVKD